MSGGEVEMYCTAKSVRELIDAKPLPLQNCRECWRCTGEFFDPASRALAIGCHGKGIRSRDGREGQFCTIFAPRWNKKPDGIP